jgi:N-methylhydantoinase B/oxoprolinase/acetone carboxylase alpha subunit
MIIDLSKSDAQRKGFVNSVYAATYANAVGAAVLAFDPSLARYHNDGTLRCLEVIAPEGLVASSAATRRRSAPPPSTLAS